MTHLNRELRPILLLCLLVLMPIITPGVTANEAADAIEAEGGKWAHYYENEDLEGLMTLYVDDVVVALHGQPALYGKAAVRDYFAARLGKAVLRQKRQDKNDEATFYKCHQDSPIRSKPEGRRRLHPRSESTH